MTLFNSLLNTVVSNGVNLDVAVSVVVLAVVLLVMLSGTALSLAAEVDDVGFDVVVSGCCTSG